MEQNKRIMEKGKSYLVRDRVRPQSEWSEIEKLHLKIAELQGQAPHYGDIRQMDVLFVGPLSYLINEGHGYSRWILQIDFDARYEIMDELGDTSLIPSLRRDERVYAEVNCCKF